MKTYVSLFSSAGIGCYGFKQAGFECIATNEFIERRLNVQKNNHKCKYETGYFSLTNDTVLLYNVITHLFFKYEHKMLRKKFIPDLRII